MRPRARIERTAPTGKRKPNMRYRLAHRDFVKSLPCLKCGGAPCDPAHVRNGTDGGTGLTPSDRYIVPLCRSHHDEQHRRGEGAFWAELGIDPLDVACRLWTVSGDAEAGLRAIERARQAMALRRSHDAGERTPLAASRRPVA